MILQFIILPIPFSKAITKKKKLTKLKPKAIQGHIPNSLITKFPYPTVRRSQLLTYTLPRQEGCNMIRKADFLMG